MRRTLRLKIYCFVDILAVDLTTLRGRLSFGGNFHKKKESYEVRITVVICAYVQII